jgi:hypothetical protein
MKIYVSHAASFDYKKELYEPIKNSRLYNLYDFSFPHEGNELLDAREIIKKSNLVLAEVSFPSTGQGIELGWANLLKIPIVCISKRASKVSASLKCVTGDFIEYTDLTDLIDRLTNFLKAPH